METKKLLITGGIIVAVAAVGIGLSAGRGSVDKPKQATRSQSTATTTGAAAAGEFRDPAAGFSLSYPKGWTKLDSQDEQVVLVAAEPSAAQNTGGSILVRVVPIGARITAESLGEARKITDAIVASTPGVEMKAEPATLTQGGLPGYFYFYTFADQLSGGRGAHSHYFLFKDDKMITLVFQALPEGDFVRLADTFDAIADSFRVL